ncbi:hypothetical protein FH608_043600 [Nonomuraea phyllanthi]|uniref:Uncharacterized protein n=1 Tax=Nonomuraea phyllanthi TaxID=2219224 RepID=A0A5C4VDN0_9ACTN|nr:hypothetical protein [Nonomuraea phyllanthi]KAB8188639.1 hypothetical protein FH608_043600 [Nonomuraea phyllanthi]QFY13326.1 hypothetical protein GBF35_48200 [Nonomuraea phyllanthi]
MGRTLLAGVAMAAVVLGGHGAAAGASPRPAAAQPRPAVAEPRPAVPVATASAPAGVADDLECLRLRGARACVGPDGSERPGITIEDTANDHYHPAVEYYLNGYLGTKYVIHNTGRKGAVRGTREIGRVVTFRAAIYNGDRRVKYGKWKTVHDMTKYPVKRQTRVTPAAARARSKTCTSTKGAATLCFGGRDTFVFACDTRADRRQARAEYYVAGDPTARFEIHQLAGTNTCGKAEHGELRISMYRASVFNGNQRIATRLYKYN